jgi:SAM-dependent methyltransferase
VLGQWKAVWLATVRGHLRRAAGRPVHGDPLAQYEIQWRKKGFDRYVPRDLKGAGTPWIWRDFRFALSNEAGAAIRLLYLEDALTPLQPTRVLEVGCGNGINLHLLSGRFPDARFTGLEATREGCAAARRLVGQGRLPPELQAFAPFEVADATGVSRVRIVQGLSGCLPFPDQAFDVVVTSLALEQMEETRDLALSELARVTSAHVVMLEPFRDVNQRGLRRRYVRAQGYFQGTIADLGRFGLAVTSTTTDLPHKAWLGTAVVVARRRGV